jgi:hypothetical protein
MGHLLMTLQKKRILAQDGFNRADSVTSLNNANTGQAWSVISAGGGVAGISSNQAYLSTSPSSYSLALIDVGRSRYAASIKLIIVTGAVFYFRAVDESNFFMIRNNGGVYELYKRISAAFTLLGTYSTVANNDILRVELFGTNNIAVYVNGILQISASDNSLVTATKVGFGGFASNSTSARFDEFKVVDI